MEHCLAVCSWSLQPENAAELVERIQKVGVRFVQLNLSPIAKNPAAWEGIQELLTQAGVEIMSGMTETIGEDYTTLESIRETGGIVPDNQWENNWNHISKVVQIAAKLGIHLVTFHAGFIPHEPSSARYNVLKERILKLAALFRDNGITMGLETGQERAEHLKDFLERLDCDNVRINFDPANVLLYGNGDPIQAIDTLAPYIYQCHLKDANRTKVPGTWGTEMAVGEGEVDWKAFFTTLKKHDYQGNFSLEREAGDQRIVDLTKGRVLAEKLISEIF